jgi:triosephosphate isomerase
MSRRPLIAGNWKMHLDHLEAIAFVQRLTYRLDAADFEDVEVALVPPFTALRSLQTVFEGDRLSSSLCAPSCHWEDSGAYTGEVSAPMLAKLRVRYVLCGHSERRALFGETDQIVNSKLHAVLRHGMTPILCVGETLEQREQDQAADIVVGQLRGSLEGVDGDAAAEMVIAYEPVWAIGTGRTATPDDAQQMCSLVRSTLGDRYGDRVAEAVRVQYGGSVKPGNAAALLRQPDVDGALVGGASLEPDDFAVICRFQRL